MGTKHSDVTVDTLELLSLIQKKLASLHLLFVTRNCSLLLNKLRNTAAGLGALEQEVVTRVRNELRVLRSLPLLLHGDLRNEHLRVWILLLGRVRLFKHLLHRRVGTVLHIIRVYLLAQLRAQLVIELLAGETVGSH